MGVFILQIYVCLTWTLWKKYYLTYQALFH